MSDQALGFYRTGDLSDLPGRVSDTLHARFIGHTATGEWRLVWTPVRDGVELVLILPEHTATDEAVEDLVHILDAADFRPLTEAELDDAIARAEIAIRDGRIRTWSDQREEDDDTDRG